MPGVICIKSQFEIQAGKSPVYVEVAVESKADKIHIEYQNPRSSRCLDMNLPA